MGDDDLAMSDDDTNIRADSLPSTKVTRRIGNKRPARDLSTSPKLRRKGHKPVRLQALKFDGSNYAVWQIKIQAAFRYVGVSLAAEGGTSASDQLGIDLLTDSVEDGLLPHVVPPGPSISPFAVLQQFQGMFGKANESFHSELIASLWSLKQLPAEGVQTYMSRSTAIHDQLVRTGGVFPSEIFLQCFERGLLEVYCLTVKFLHNGPPARINFSCLLGDLLAEEARLHHHQGLQHGQFQGVAGAVTEPGSRRQWAQSKAGAGAPATKNSKAGNRCWNCNKEGHKTDTCPEPIVKPWRHVPAGFRHRGTKVAGDAAAAKPAAGLIA
jgi:hypothetical protein